MSHLRRWPQPHSCPFSLHPKPCFIVVVFTECLSVSLNLKSKQLVFSVYRQSLAHGG